MLNQVFKYILICQNQCTFLLFISTREQKDNFIQQEEMENGGLYIKRFTAYPEPYGDVTSGPDAGANRGYRCARTCK